MKTKSLFLLPALIAGIGLILTGRVRAQTLTTLYSFSARSNGDYGTNSDGAQPKGLVLSGNTLYGTTWQGGSSGNGTVFAINTNGTGFTILHRFTGGDDGGGPSAGLTLSGNTLYGTAEFGAPSATGRGTVFAVNTDGTGFTILHTFTALGPDPCC